jgi:hypothetical protein
VAKRKPSPSECGAYLETCRCQGRGTAPRSAAEIEARHRASVARARRYGWGDWITRKPTEQAAAAPSPRRQPRLVPDPAGRGWAA